MKVLVRNPRVILSYLPYAAFPRVYTHKGKILQLDSLSPTESGSSATELWGQVNLSKLCIKSMGCPPLL